MGNRGGKEKLAHPTVVCLVFQGSGEGNEEIASSERLSPLWKQFA